MSGTFSRPARLLLPAVAAAWAAEAAPLCGALAATAALLPPATGALTTMKFFRVVCLIRGLIAF